MFRPQLWCACLGVSVSEPVKFGPVQYILVPRATRLQVQNVVDPPFLRPRDQKKRRLWGRECVQYSSVSKLMVLKIEKDLPWGRETSPTSPQWIFLSTREGSIILRKMANWEPYRGILWRNRRFFTRPNMVPKFSKPEVSKPFDYIVFHALGENGIYCWRYQVS